MPAHTMGMIAAESRTGNSPALETSVPIGGEGRDIVLESARAARLQLERLCQSEKKEES